MNIFLSYRSLPAKTRGGCMHKGSPVPAHDPAQGFAVCPERLLSLSILHRKSSNHVSPGCSQVFLFFQRSMSWHASKYQEIVSRDSLIIRHQMGKKRPFSLSAGLVTLKFKILGFCLVRFFFWAHVLLIHDEMAHMHVDSGHLESCQAFQGFLDFSL